MKQSSFNLNLGTRKTRKQVFLQQMETVVPWAALVELITPYYCEGRDGRPLFALETMLRVHFMQQWFSLSDPAMEEAFFDTPLYREFAQLDTFGRLPDESTILEFRHRLEKHKLADQILATVNELLQERGLLLKAGTAVDATLGGLSGAPAQQPATFHPRSLKLRVLHFNFESTMYSFGFSHPFSAKYLDSITEPGIFALGRLRRLVSLALTLLLSTQAHALTLRELLDASANTHPTVRAARFQSDAAGDGVDVAKRQYWPTLSVQAESKKAIEGGSSLLRVEQTLWNGGLTGATVRGAEISLDMAKARVDIQQQKMALQVGAAWQSLWSAQGRLKVAESSLKQLARFEQMMRRRVEAGLSGPVELELVRARMLQARVDASRAKTDTLTTLERLEQLTRLKGLRETLGELPVGQQVQAFDAPIARLQTVLTTQIDEVVARQPDVRLAHDETLYARQQVDIRKAQALPQAFVRVDQSLTGRRETSVYFGLNYTTGAGLSVFLEAQALSKRAQAGEQSAEAAELDARQTLVVDLSELQNARLRLDALSEAVRGADTVLASYERQFVANRKSWQDLMNAVRELGQNEAARVDAETQLVGALLRIQLRVDPSSIDPSVEARPKASGNPGQP